MSDISFKEGCPCGADVEVSGYTAEVRLQAELWRKIHKPHMNAIAKAVEANRVNPLTYYPWTWPNPPWTVTNGPDGYQQTFTTDTASGIVRQQHG